MIFVQNFAPRRREKNEALTGREQRVYKTFPIEALTEQVGETFISKIVCNDMKSVWRNTGKQK